MAVLNTIIITLAAAIAITLLFQATTSAAVADVDDDVEYYTIDNPKTTTRFRSRSLFLNERIRKGMRCTPPGGGNNICDGVSANNGTSLLYCCKNNCRNVVQDKNNCGRCGNKCGFGLSCCNGACISVAYDANHCGECNQKCEYGHKCEYGSCGYA